MRIREPVLLLLFSLARASEVIESRVHPTTVHYRASPLVRDDHRRLGELGQREPLRITPYYAVDALTELTAALAVRVADELIPAGIARWSRALAVDRVEGPLRLDRPCESFFYDTDGCVGVCHTLKDHVACGEATVADAHFGAARACTTCVGPDCADASSECDASAAGAGANETDFLLYVTATQTERCVAGSAAYAGRCFVDQRDRPIAGALNLCPESLAHASDDERRVIVLHELAHALGFSAASIAYFRHANGTVRTARDACGAPALATIAACPDGTTDRTVRWPADSLALSEGPRGGGAPVARLVTPAVRAAARRHFACDALAGAELENQPSTEAGSGTRWGSHWEERAHNEEVTSKSPQEQLRSLDRSRRGLAIVAVVLAPFSHPHDACFPCRGAAVARTDLTVVTHTEEVTSGKTLKTSRGRSHRSCRGLAIVAVVLAPFSHPHDACSPCRGAPRQNPARAARPR